MRSKPVDPPSFEELLAKVRDLPEGHRGNIVDGAVFVVEPASSARAHTLGEISATLFAGSPLGDPVPEGYTFLDDVEIAYGDEGLLVADIAGWKLPHDRLAAAASPLRIAPVWVCEVLGGSSRAFALTAKRRAYAELGVQSLWIADPEAHVLEVFQNQRGKWLLTASYSEESNIAPAPFEAVHFDASDLWLRTATRPARPTPKRSK
jgi:Uma2 family endonuclease